MILQQKDVVNLAGTAKNILECPGLQTDFYLYNRSHSRADISVKPKKISRAHPGYAIRILQK